MLSVWRYRRFHVSILIGWICCGLLIGIALGKQAHDNRASEKERELNIEKQRTLRAHNKAG